MTFFFRGRPTELRDRETCFVWNGEKVQIRKRTLWVQGSGFRVYGCLSKVRFRPKPSRDTVLYGMARRHKFYKVLFFLFKVCFMFCLEGEKAQIRKRTP